MNALLDSVGRFDAAAASRLHAAFRDDHDPQGVALQPAGRPPKAAGGGAYQRRGTALVAGWASEPRSAAEGPFW